MKIHVTGKTIWLSQEAVDFRKAINGLSALIERIDRESIYVFYNKAKNKVKILGWHGNGFILLYKRLEKGKFTISHSQQLDEKKLSWFLAGLNWEQMTNFGELKYSNFY